MTGIPADHMHILVKHFVGTRPSSILDIGLSYGHIDFIDRDFCVALMDKPFRNEKSEMVIDGIETFRGEKQNIQPDFYDTVYKGDIFQVIEKLDTYDMVVLGDVLEHLEKKQALRFIDDCIAHSDNHLMICVSLGEKRADNKICGHICDMPVSFWSHEDFSPFVYPQKFLQYTTENYGIFLVNKEDYIDHKIVELYPLPKNNGLNPAFNLREKFSLSRENISKIDFSRYAKYADNLERSNYFLERKFLEHYRLIAHLSTRFSNATLFDVGSNLGYSALALSYNSSNKVVSYDIVERGGQPNPRESTNIEYYTGDVLEDKRLFESPLIMLDTNHNGLFEKRFYSFLKENNYKGLLFLDDIYLNESTRDLWNSITDPKEDVTDLGHWAGSGLVEFS